MSGRRPNQGFIETSVAFLTVLGTIVVFLGALTVVVTEIPMVLIEKYWRQRFICSPSSAGGGAGYDKGFEASERQWEAWNERRRAAETKGEPFPEPRPSSQANGDRLASIQRPPSEQQGSPHYEAA